MARPVLANRDARRLFLHKHGLAQTPSGPGKGADLLKVITDLGFVQVDSINTVARAHHMILFARRPAYRPRALAKLLEQDRSLFEHWTHDASVIPTEFHPHWRLRFERDAQKLRAQWRAWRRDGFEDQMQAVIDRIRTHGACSSADVGEGEKRSSGGWWDWHPSKTALEYLWRTGTLSVCHRSGFRKQYDLTENVLPGALAHPGHSTADTIDWACNAALDRLGFATSGELAAFWALITPAEAKTWAGTALQAGQIIEIDVQNHDGTQRRCFARPDVLQQAADAPAPTSRLRTLSPFDPALRDRKRAERLFGFHYRIEIFVPEAQRKYGYYVFPLLQGDRLVGRIDMKAHRDQDCLRVTAVWPEPGVKWGEGRSAKLRSDLTRMARLAQVSDVVFQDGWLRDTP